jgi:hypothetical protein
LCSQNKNQADLEITFRVTHSTHWNSSESSHRWSQSARYFAFNIIINDSFAIMTASRVWAQTKKTNILNYSFAIIIIIIIIIIPFGIALVKEIRAWKRQEWERW